MEKKSQRIRALEIAIKNVIWDKVDRRIKSFIGSKRTDQLAKQTCQLGCPGTKGDNHGVVLYAGRTFRTHRKMVFEISTPLQK